MSQKAVVIGGGPAGLMAAETLGQAGLTVTVYEQMQSVGRKLLMAGRGGLNLTHAEPLPRFLARYGAAGAWFAPVLEGFPPEALIAWCNGLGQPTFTGSSDRVFPVAMKASPLLRAWLRRLQALGVAIRVRHRWDGWDEDGLPRFETASGPVVVRTSVMILALGGASWARLGSDGRWAEHFPGLVAPFQPANCGFRVDWSAHFRSRFAGQPLKRVAIRFGGETVRGEAMITDGGLEGGVVYALSARLREAIGGQGSATVALDLRPDLDEAVVEARLGGPRGSQSLANTLRKQVGLTPVAIGLVQEALHGGASRDDLAVLVKGLKVRLVAPAPLERAISTAGGLRAEALDARLMLRDRPGVFAAGEMLDWEAPTGGYLLQACFSSGVAAAKGALAWLERQG